MLENSVINGADATIICTEKRKEQISGSRPKRLTVIHNTPSAAQQKPCDNKTQQTGKIKIVYVGILEPSRMLRAIAAAVSENSNLEFHVAGFGTMEDFFVEQAQIHDNIYYYGRLTYDHTLSLENECDIMTAIYDPRVDNHRFAAPNKFYESLMLGKPVIMVRGTGMSEVVEENGIGELIEYSKEGFIDGVNRLIERKGEWHSIGYRMKEIYRNQYCWDEMERRLIQVYSDLQNEKMLIVNNNLNMYGIQGDNARKI
jgi:glycosyltransferase involved in cell wall biosynthesis